MKLAVVVNDGRATAAQFAARLARAAEVHGLEIVTGAPADLVVAVGGDGTVLEAAGLALEWDVPVLGFDLGTIGFLAEAEPEELTGIVARLAGGDFRVEPRVTVEARLDTGAGGVGLNDVVIEKIESQRLVVLGIEIDGHRFLSHRADGLVVATSTGSTAYAFSAGGPLVDPTLDALLVTPVAPHSLFNRTLVLPPVTRIDVTVERARPVRVSVDGREIGSLGLGGVVTVCAGPRPLKFLRLGDESFPSRVTRKFELG